MSEVAALLAALDGPGKRERRQAAETLGRLAGADETLRRRLSQELAAGDVVRRWTVALALHHAGDRSERLWPASLAAIGSDDGDLRWAAARLVVGLEMADLTARLVAAATAGGAEQRKMALYCLRERGVAGAAAERVALASLEAPEPGVRLAAMSALARLAVDRSGAARALVARLADADAGVRRAAAATLGRIGVPEPAAVAALRTAAASADGALARAARAALERVEGEGAAS